MIRRPPRSTQSRSSAASDVYKRQEKSCSRCFQVGGSEQHSPMSWHKYLKPFSLQSTSFFVTLPELDVLSPLAKDTSIRRVCSIWLLFSLWQRTTSPA